jgi:glucose/arabinose dehydrogenase
MTTLLRRPVARRRAIGTLAAAAAAALIAGGSSASAAPIPTVLDFSAPVAGTVGDKDGEGTGFESVQANKNGPGHLPANLDLTGGQLLLTSTAGDTGRTVNTQANALQVTVTPTNGYTVSALIDGPLPVTTPFQSAGIFVGPDQDNYVKLVAGVGGTAEAPVPRFQLATETGAVLSQVNVPAGIDSADAIQLLLTVGPDGAVAASAIVDGVTTPVGDTSLPGLGSGGDEAGIVSTNAGTGATPFTAKFDNFAVMAQGLFPGGGTPTPGNVIAFKPKRTIIRGNEGTGGLVVPGFGEFGQRTLPTGIARNPVTGQIYVATQFGRIYVFTLDADHNATLVNTINNIFNKPNTGFTGAPQPGQTGRQVVGLSFDPDPQGGNGVLYVTHSDPEIFEANQPGTSTVDPSSGVLTKLVVNGQGGVVSDTDLIKGLPRSGENHGPNGTAVGPDGMLYVALGGNTNNGAQSQPFSFFPETPLSSSVLKVNPDAIGSQTVDVSKGSRFSFTSPPSTAYSLAGSAADNGTVAGKVELYATGFRNPYDLLWHSNGKLYTAENEANQGFGPTPGAADGCPGPSVEQATGPDEFFQVQAGGFHGHPNPSRNQCAEGTGVQPIEVFANNSSSTGVEEYTSNAFGALLQGQVLVTNYAQGDSITRLKLNADGSDVVEKATLATGFKDPVNLLVLPDGAILVAEHSTTGDSFAQISLLEPIAINCPQPGTPLVDSDGDGFIDFDEVANGTDFCNPADAPGDYDGDGFSNGLDPDDDNDGKLDAVDPFQLDPANGGNTPIPFVEDFNQSAAGGWFGTGLEGIQLSSKGGGPLAGKISAGGAGGYLAITATEGTNQGLDNSQNNALQQGFRASVPVTVTTTMSNPLSSGAPKGSEQGGIFLGPGEDDYVKLVVHANSGKPVIELSTEQKGTFKVHAKPELALPQSVLKLFLDADPKSNAIRARYQLGTDPVRTIGTLNVPETWMEFPAAAGLITSKAGSNNPDVSFVFDEFAIRAGTSVPRASGSGLDVPPKEGETVIRDGAVCKAVTPRKANTGRRGKITLSAEQLLITQRTAQAAVRRLNAVQQRLVGKLGNRDLCGGAFEARHFNTGIVVGKGGTHTLEPANPDPLKVEAGRTTQGRPLANVTLSAQQLLINQRISQAAVRRANALTKRLEEGLTGGDIVNGSITAGKLAEGARILKAGVSPRVIPPSRTVIEPARQNPRGAANVSLTVAQFRINQRIAQAAVRRANALMDLLESGLTGADFKAKSVTRVDLAASLRP